MTATTPDLRRLARTFWEARRNGDVATARTLLSPDVEWTVVGTTHEIARTYHGHAGFFDELAPALRSHFRPGTFSQQLLAVHADEDQQTAFARLHDSALALNGRRFELDVLVVMEYDAGLLVRVHEYLDLNEVRLAFAAPAETGSEVAS